MVKRKEPADSAQAPGASAVARAVLNPQAVDASGVVVAGQTDLDLLRGGHIDVAEYVRRHADSATAHLVDRVSAERLADLRDLLAAQALQDPALAQVLDRLREVAADVDTPA
jgi:hypothetical protein